MFSSHWVAPIQRCLLAFALLSGRQQGAVISHQHNIVRTAINSSGQIGDGPHRQTGRPDGAGAGAAREMAAKSAETMMTDFMFEMQRNLDVKVLSGSSCRTATVYGTICLYVNQLYSWLHYLT